MKLRAEGTDLLDARPLSPYETRSPYGSQSPYGEVESAGSASGAEGPGEVGSYGRESAGVGGEGRVVIVP